MSRMRTLQRNLDEDAVIEARKKSPTARKATAHSKHVASIQKKNFRGETYFKCTECPVLEFQVEND